MQCLCNTQIQIQYDADKRKTAVDNEITDRETICVAVIALHHAQDQFIRPTVETYQYTTNHERRKLRRRVQISINTTYETCLRDRRAGAWPITTPQTDNPRNRLSIDVKGNNVSGADVQQAA